MDRAALLFCLLAAVLAPARTAGQQLELRREQPEIAWGGCPRLEEPPRVPQQQRDEAVRLAAQATEAAILGNTAEARELLARASTLDPSSAALAYRHGRALEELGRPGEALAEYCRNMTLAPGSPDAAEVRGRIDELTRSFGAAVPAPAAEAFAAGLVGYDARRYREAEAAFTRAVDAARDWSAAVYNRAVVRITLGNRQAAAADLRRYLELNPGAADFDSVLAVIAVLRERPAVREPSATNALAAGLIVPGLGHFTTGRPVTGAIVLGAAGAAIAAGILVERVDVDCLSPPVDGVCPPDQVRGRNVDRPLLIPAVAAAAAIGVAGAIDAFLAVRRRNEAARSQPQRTGMVEHGSVLLLPQDGFAPADGLRVDLLRITF